MSFPASSFSGATTFPSLSFPRVSSQAASASPVGLSPLPPRSGFFLSSKQQTDSRFFASSSLHAPSTSLEVGGGTYVSYPNEGAGFSLLMSGDAIEAGDASLGFFPNSSSIMPVGYPARATAGGDKNASTSSKGDLDLGPTSFWSPQAPYLPGVEGLSSSASQLEGSIPLGTAVLSGVGNSTSLEGGLSRLCHPHFLSSSSSPYIVDPDAPWAYLKGIKNPVQESAPGVTTNRPKRTRATASTCERRGEVSPPPPPTGVGDDRENTARSLGAPPPVLKISFGKKQQQQAQQPTEKNNENPSAGGSKGRGGRVGAGGTKNRKRTKQQQLREETASPTVVHPLGCVAATPPCATGPLTLSPYLFLEPRDQILQRVIEGFFSREQPSLRSPHSLSTPFSATTNLPSLCALARNRWGNLLSVMAERAREKAGDNIEASLLLRAPGTHSSQTTSTVLFAVVSPGKHGGGGAAAAAPHAASYQGGGGKPPRPAAAATTTPPCVDFLVLPSHTVSSLVCSGTLKTTGWLRAKLSRKGITDLAWPTNVSNPPPLPGSQTSQPTLCALVEVLNELSLPALCLSLLDRPGSVLGSELLLPLGGGDHGGGGGVIHMGTDPPPSSSSSSPHPPETLSQQQPPPLGSTAVDLPSRCGQQKPPLDRVDSTWKFDVVFRERSLNYSTPALLKKSPFTREAVRDSICSDLESYLRAFPAAQMEELKRVKIPEQLAEKVLAALEDLARDANLTGGGR